MNEQNTNEGLISKLFNSRHYDAANNYQPFYEGPMVDLVRALAAEAAVKGMTLSRWETHRGKWDTHITWALHTGPRTAQFRDLADDAVLDVIYLTTPEGKTTACAAYNALTGLAQMLEAHQPETP